MKKDYAYVRKSFTCDGKRYYVAGKDEADAYKKLVRLEDSLKRGEKVVNENVTVDRWYQEWKTLYKDSASLTKKSRGMYDEKYKGYIKPAIGSMRLKDIRDVHLQKILNTQAGYSFSHVSKLRRVMMEVFSRARKSRLILYDPSEDLTLPEYTKKSRRSITDQERFHILQVAETHPSGLWVSLMLYSGLRPGEIAALQWKDIDFERNEIHVNKAVESGGREIKGPKTPSGNRDIPIHQELRSKLLEHKGDPFAPVVPTRAGNYQNSNSIQRLWKSFKRALDISMGAKLYRNQIVESVVSEDLVPYCLRHTFCTDLEAAGVPINVAKVLMGHSDISITANIYTHKNQSVLHEGIARLGRSSPEVKRHAQNTVQKR